MGTNATGGSLYFDAGVNIDQLIADFNKAKQAAGQFTDQVQKEGKKMDDSFAGLGKSLGSIGGILAGYMSLNFAGQFVTSVATVRGEFQKLEVAFNTMLGNKEKADALMAQIVDYAATTPFELQDIAGGAKQLLAYGTASEKIIPIMKQLGDVSAGLGQPIGRLVTVFGQIQLKGKLMGDDLRQINEAGVPLIAELAKNLGKSNAEIQAMVTAGQIGAADVAKAFETMAGAGGKFEGMTAAMSKTIAGQISNLKDAWTSMLNDIGKGNEGLISDALGFAKGIVDNYQKVVDILKVLVVAYGSYKAVLMATAAVQKVSAAVSTLQSMIRMKEAITAATLSQRGFNKAAMINPYVAAVAGVIALVTAISTLIKRSQDVQGNIDSLNESIAAVGKQDNTSELVARFEELNGKTVKTKEEQEELKNIIIAIGKEMPGVIQDYGLYGEAISLNTEKLYAQNEELRKQKKLMLEGDLGDAEEKLTKLLKEQERLQKMLSTGKLVAADLSVQNWYSLSKSQMEKYRKELIETTDKIGELQGKIQEGNNAVNGIKSVDTMKLLAPYRELFGNIDGITNEKAKELKVKLQGLLSDPLIAGSEDAKKKVSEQMDKLAAYLEGPNVSERIKKVMAQLKIESEKLLQMKSPDSHASDEAIKKQQAIVDELTKILEAGDKKKTSVQKKGTEDLKKAEEKKNEAFRKLADERCQDELNAREKEISIMQDGYSKKVAEADFELQKELARIDKERQARVDAINDANGKKSGDKGFITSLSADDEKVFTDQIIGAVQIREYKIKELSKASADELLQIEKDLNAQLQTERDKDYQDVKDYYDNLRKEKKVALSPEDFAKVKPQIDEAEKTATKAIDSKYAIATIDMQENLALKENEINQVRQKNEHKYQESVLAIQKEFNQKRIKEVENLQDDESKKKLAGYKADEEALKKEQELLDEQNKQRQQDQLIAGAFEFADALLGASDASKEVKEQLGMALNVVGKLASGDYIGAAISLLTGLADEIMTLFESADAKSAKAIAKQNERLSEMISNAKLLSDTLSRTSGVSYSSQSLKQLLYGLVTLNNTTIALNKLINTPTTGSYNWIGRSFSVVTQLNTEIEKIQQKLLSTSDKLTDKQRTQLEDQLKLYQEMMGSIDDAISSLTGTSVAELATGLQDAFLSGSDAAKNWGNTVEDVIKNIVKQQAISKLIMGPINKIVLDFLDSVSIYGMDGFAITQFKTDLSNAFGTIKPVWDAFTEGMKGIGIDISGANAAATAAKAEGLTGAIKGITAEQADLLGGVLISMREYQVKGYTETKGSFLTISDALNRQLTATNEIRQNELMKFNSQFTTLVEINRQTNQQIIDMRQFDLSEILIVNRQIAANTSYNKELPAIKAELIAMNAQIKNL